MKNYRFLFCDLDDTLITTVSGNTFPTDCTDFRIKKDVLDCIKRMPKLKAVYIVTDQGGVPEYTPVADFTAKIGAIRSFIEYYVGVPCLYSCCFSKNKDCSDRKPNTGMLEEFVSPDDTKTKKWCLMIGDASGKEGDFSDSDLQTAKNFGIDYLDVEDFVNGMEKNK